MTFGLILASLPVKVSPRPPQAGSSGSSVIEKTSRTYNEARVELAPPDLHDPRRSIWARAGTLTKLSQKRQ